MRKIIGLPGLIITNLVFSILAIIFSMLLLAQHAVPWLRQELPGYIANGVELPGFLGELISAEQIAELGSNATDIFIEGVADPLTQKMELWGLAGIAVILLMSCLPGAKYSWAARLVAVLGLVVFIWMGMDWPVPEQLAALCSSRSGRLIKLLNSYIV